MKKKIIFIVGPTAIGKSSLAIKLAKKIRGEIINADSMQVYSNLSILTARPSENDHNKVKHHLYGYVDGSVRYNVFKWCNNILPLLKKNIKKDIPSIVVGGTGMYINSILMGLVDVPFISELIKLKTKKLIEIEGVENFFNLVKNIDNESVEKINKNDIQRLSRIWEVYQVTNKPYSEWLKNENNFFFKNISYSLFLFTPDRNKIYKNVDERFIKMLKEGAIEEVKILLKKNLNSSLPIMRAHGVPEISKFVLNNSDINECISKGQQVTRNYVKRQLTWWRSSKLPIDETFHQFPSEIDINSLNLY